MPTHLIVGTAGHIDHGKTALVKALTGIDADRLPDEQRRGMTIDLGFASLRIGDFHLGVVDVPGHERFIRNMLCGATAIDLALLVIAATESVKAQTREHLEILKLLGVEHGVVALTKCDLVDTRWIDLVEDEARELVAGTPLGDAPLVRLSSLTGQGLPALRDQLAAAAQRASLSPRRRLAAAPFRMAVDRAFSAHGHGTVLTGSVASGRVSVGDEVAIEPRGTTARIRSIQSHGTALDTVARGQRAAINLVGVGLDVVRRGTVLAEPGSLKASRRLHIRWTGGDDQRSRLHHAVGNRRLKVRMHVGTAEIQGRLRLLERSDSATTALLAEIELEQPVACVWGEPLIIRAQSPTTTLGGGRVIDPEASPIGRRAQEVLPYLHDLAAGDEPSRVAALMYLNGPALTDDLQLRRRTGVSGDCERLRESLATAGRVVRIDSGGGRVHYLHAAVVDSLMARVEQLLKKQHQQNRLQAYFPPSVFDKIFAVHAGWLRDAVLRRMESAGRVVIAPAGVASPELAPKLSKPQRQLYTQIIQQHREAGCAPPALRELEAAAGSRRAAVQKLVELAIAEGHLVRVGVDWCLHREVEADVLRTLTKRLGSNAFAVRELRELLHVSRKYLVPLCEHLDRIGFTCRKGNLRTIVAAATPSGEEVAS